MDRLAEVFKLDPKGFHLARGLTIAGVLLVPLVVLGAIGKDKFWLSVSFGALFVALSDPGGDYGPRLRRLVGIALVGALLTALGFAIGGGPWGWVLLAAFAVTLLAGLAVRFGLHVFVGAMVLNVWFLIALAIPAGEHVSFAKSDCWAQAMAWLIGAALWIVVTFFVWLARGRSSYVGPIPEIPEGMDSIPLTKKIVLFTLIRALAVGLAVEIAFGLDLPNADWMPLATLVAMKTNLQQAALVAEQRLAGTIIGALVAAMFLLTVDSKHALEAVIILLGAFSASIRMVNYAIYCAGIAALVLIALDLPHPTNYAVEFERVLFTFAGVGIAVVVMALASLLNKRPAAGGAAAVSPSTA